MLVFKKDALGQEIEEISQNLTKLKLVHFKTRVFIELVFDINGIANPDNLYPTTNDNTPSQMYSNYTPYIVYQENDEGLYDHYEQFGFDSDKTLIQHFKDAIAFFEKLILDELKEQEPTPPPPPKGDDEDDFDPFGGDFDDDDDKEGDDDVNGGTKGGDDDNDKEGDDDKGGTKGGDDDEGKEGDDDDEGGLVGGDGDFDTDLDDDEINEIEKQIDKIKVGDKEIDTDNDISKIKSFLKTGDIKKNFTKSQVKRLVGKSKVLGQDQSKKLNKALKQIFE